MCVSVYFLIQFNLNSFPATAFVISIHLRINPHTHIQIERWREGDRHKSSRSKTDDLSCIVVRRSLMTGRAIVYTLLLEIFYSNRTVNCNHLCMLSLNNCRFMRPPTPHNDFKRIRLTAVSSVPSKTRRWRNLSFQPKFSTEKSVWFTITKCGNEDKTVLVFLRMPFCLMMILANKNGISLNSINRHVDAVIRYFWIIKEC